MIEILSVVASIFEVVGMFFIAHRKIYGFYSFIIGNILWVAYVLITGKAVGLLIVCSVGFCMNVFSIINWKKLDKLKN